MNSPIVMSTIFVGITVPLFLYLNRLLDPDRDRLRRMSQGQSVERTRFSLPDSLVDALGSRFLNRGSNPTQELQKVLRTAGYDHPLALEQFRTIRFLLVLLCLGVTGLLGVIVPDPQLLTVLVGGLIALILVFSLPRLIIEMQAKARGHAIARGLPLAMDLMAVSLQAGLDPVHSAGKVSTSLRRAYPELSEEFRRVFQIAQLHSMQKGWDQLADRVPSDAIRNLCSIMKQSERVGSDAASALLEYASSYRLQARQRAEAQANRTSFWMLFPTITCLFVAAAIVLIGPVFHQFITGGASVQKTQELQNRSTSRVESFRGNSRLPTTATEITPAASE